MLTRVSLLFRIRDQQNGAAWAEFVQLYAPLLHAYGMKCGLQDADAADLAQDTLRLLLRAAPEFHYDPAKGSFRGWLFTVARNELRKFISRKQHQGRGSGDTAVQARLEAEPAEVGEEEWDREHQMALFRHAAGRVKPEFREKSWLAFWRTLVLGEPIEQVSRDLGLSTGAVYIARSRVTHRIRQEIERLQEEGA